MNFGKLGGLRPSKGLALNVEDLQTRIACFLTSACTPSFKPKPQGFRVWDLGFRV